MICPRCHAENEESFVFCIRCGARLDGKRECPSCHHLMRADAVYCNRCGTRTDGKQVCEKCGTAYSGSFCPACGAQNGKELLSKRDISRDYFAKRMTKTLSIITACLLFLSSFFIGYRMTLTKAYSEILYESGGYRGVAEAEAQLREKSRYTAIHYIVGEIEKISDAAEAMSPNPTSIACTPSEVMMHRIMSEDVFGPSFTPHSPARLFWDLRAPLRAGYPNMLRPVCRPSFSYFILRRSARLSELSYSRSSETACTETGSPKFFLR